jgi:uncharacterized protein YbjQ (UPF0145 family)
MEVEPVSVSPRDMITVTTPTVPGYRVKRVIAVVSGLTARTRGVGGKIVAGIESMKEKARRMGANAIIGLDIETSDVLQGTMLISATGTAVVIEPG